MHKLSFAATLTLLIPMKVAGQAPPATGSAHPPDQQVTVTGKTKLVCESFVPVGSIKTQKICTTQAEFDEAHDQSQIELQRMKDRQDRERQTRITRQMMQDP